MYAATMGAGDHHIFDDEPVHELPADEPKTPGWVPALGLGIFLVVLVTWLAKGNQPAATDVTAEPGSAAAPAATAPPPPPPQPAAPQPLPRPVAPGSAAPARQLTPEQAKELQKRIDEMKQRRGAPNAPTAPAPGR